MEKEDVLKKYWRIHHRQVIEGKDIDKIIPLFIIERVKAKPAASVSMLSFSMTVIAGMTMADLEERRYNILEEMDMDEIVLDNKIIVDDDGREEENMDSI